MKIFSEIKMLPEFERDFKRLSKKFRTLSDDLQIFIKVQLQIYHKLGQDNRGVFQVTDLGIDYPKIYKAKKFACKSLKGRGSATGIRIIYAYYEKEDVVEFIEIYFKTDKEREDRERIMKYYKNK